MLLERIVAQIDRTRHSRPERRAGKPVVLQLEMNLPVAVANGEQIPFAKVEELIARRFFHLACQVRELIITIEVDAELFFPCLMTFKQFTGVSSHS